MRLTSRRLLLELGAFLAAGSGVVALYGGPRLSTEARWILWIGFLAYGVYYVWQHLIPQTPTKDKEG